MIRFRPPLGSETHGFIKKFIVLGKSHRFPPRRAGNDLLLLLQGFHALLEFMEFLLDGGGAHAVIEPQHRRLRNSIWGGGGDSRSSLSAPRSCGVELVRATFHSMSTLAEIEQAVNTLPPGDQQALLHHLSAKLHASPRAGWPVPPPKVPREEIRRIQAEIDAKFSTAEGAE